MNLRKRTASLFLALALSVGLVTSAFAANYKEFIVTFPDAKVIFDAAYATKTTIKLGNDESDLVSKEVTVITAKPGSQVALKFDDGTTVVSMYGYELAKGEVYYSTPVSYTLVAGAVENAFNGKTDLILQLDSMGEIFMKLGAADASTSDTTTVPEKPTDSANPFTDVAATSPYADAVKWAVEKKITAGTTATTFAPGTTCTNGQILTFLWRAKGQPEPKNANPFTNVTESSYYYKAALWAAENGMVTGTSFDAAAACTRSQTVTYLWTLAGKPAPAKAVAFTDVAADADYAQAVAWAVEKGITTGTTATTFAPDATCTRGQIVTFLYRDMK